MLFPLCSWGLLPSCHGSFPASSCVHSVHETHLPGFHRLPSVFKATQISSGLCLSFHHIRLGGILGVLTQPRKLKIVENPLSKLALDTWYKVLIVIGTFVILLNGANLLPNYPLRETFIIGLGCIIFGIAEWMNHPMHEIIKPARYGVPTHTITDKGWKPSLIGLLLDVFGIGLIVSDS